MDGYPTLLRLIIPLAMAPASNAPYQSKSKNLATGAVALVSILNFPRRTPTDREEETMSELLGDPRTIAYLERGWGEGSVLYWVGFPPPGHPKGLPVEAIIPYREVDEDCGHIFFRVIVNGDVYARVPAQFCTVTYKDPD